MEIRIHTQAGSVETFFQDNPALVASILKGIQSTKVFAGDIITIAGDYSLTTFVASRVNRVDLIAEDLPLWKHPADILDVVELSEDEFRERSHLNDPARLERRRSPKQTGEFALVFVEVEMAGGTRIFLAAKIKVGLPAERLQRLRTLFSAASVHFRMRAGRHRDPESKKPCPSSHSILAPMLRPLMPGPRTTCRGSKSPRASPMPMTETNPNC